MSYAGAFNAAGVVGVEYRHLKISEMHKVTACKMMMITVNVSSEYDSSNYNKNRCTEHRYMCLTFSWCPSYGGHFPLRQVEQKES